MEKSSAGILIIVPTFSPNVGGVETHLDDLVKELDSSGYRVFVQTYSPITTQSAKWESKENYGNVQIRRYLWFGKNLLHKIEKKPLLDFLYITPYLFLRIFLFMLKNKNQIDIIHAQGLNAAFIGKYLKKVFKKKLIVSIHAIYEVIPDSKTAKAIKSILADGDCIMTLSKASYNELLGFGLNKDSLSIYRYWIDLDVFKPLGNKKELRKQLGMDDIFTVLFVGRLTKIKGIYELAAVADDIPEIKFLFIGNGPLENYLKEKSKKTENIEFLGRLDNKELPKYYNIADILCIPSQYEEGFGRVVMEAVACGLLVLGSNKGGIPEALDNSVSILIEPTIKNLKETVLRLANEKELCNKLKANCRNYAVRNFSDKNFSVIHNSYKKLLNN